jgi:PucR C-terminal helix-turn-helix domain/GGDEF-like domain
MGAVERGDPRVRALIESVAGTVGQQLAAVTGDVQAVIEAAIPGLQADESAPLLQASIAENLDTALRTLVDARTPGSIDAPAAAVDYARRLAQQDVPAVHLIRAYRVGQARFLRHCIEELLCQSSGDHLEGLATLEMIETVSDYVDRVVEQVLTIFGQARDDWLRDRSAVLAMRVRELLASRPVDVGATEHALGYRLDQHHVGIVAWVDGPPAADALEQIRRVVGGLGRDLGCSATPLVVPADESSAWAWIPSKLSLARTKELSAATTSEAAVSLAVGEPARGIDGFRRSHRQATSARAVALAAGDQRSPITPFVDVAPIAMLCADLDSTRAWIHETLGELAVDSSRNEGLRETARVFLQTGGSYTATAEQMFLHRNTAQYRVRKAEEVRGRPLRDGRLDVELALLACHWMKAAVLQARP